MGLHPAGVPQAKTAMLFRSFCPVMAELA